MAFWADRARQSGHCALQVYDAQSCLLCQDTVRLHPRCSEVRLAIADCIAGAVHV